MKYGRRPPKNAPALKFKAMMSGQAVIQGAHTIPAHPVSEDYIAKLPGWAMLGNDQWGDCITPETRVLRSDLMWVPAGELRVGDTLLAFDEDSRPADVEGAKSKGRYYRPSTVETVDRVLRPCYELEFDDGTIVRSSEGHLWLCGSLSNGAAWVETRDMKAGGQNASSVNKPFEPWKTNDTRVGGYLAAAWDGEGNLDLNGSSMRLVESRGSTAG